MAMTRTQAFGNIFDILGQDVMKKIYEYDDTYKTIFSKQVVENIWRAKWRRWLKTAPECQSPFVATVMECLFESWYVNVPTYLKDNSAYFKQFYFSENITISCSEVIPNTLYDVSVYMITGDRGFVRCINCYVTTVEKYREIDPKDGKRSRDEPENPIRKIYNNDSYVVYFYDMIDYA